MKTKKEGKLWWRSLTPEQQADYRCDLLEQKGEIPNWDKEYSKVLKENNYLK